MVDFGIIGRHRGVGVDGCEEGIAQQRPDRLRGVEATELCPPDFLDAVQHPRHRGELVGQPVQGGTVVGELRRLRIGYSDVGAMGPFEAHPRDSTRRAHPAEATHGAAHPRRSLALSSGAVVAAAGRSELGTMFWLFAIAAVLISPYGWCVWRRIRADHESGRRDGTGGTGGGRRPGSPTSGPDLEGTDPRHPIGGIATLAARIETFGALLEAATRADEASGPTESWYALETLTADGSPLDDTTALAILADVARRNEVRISWSDPDPDREGVRRLVLSARAPDVGHRRTQDRSDRSGQSP
ncbi:MAG: hypothetical protein R2698_05510 [Microthrixaceae bacterium]